MKILYINDHNKNKALSGIKVGKNIRHVYGLNEFV